MREVIPFVIQGLIMSVDEFYCHRRREMRRWERLGHPFDTLVFIFALLWLLWVEGSWTGPGFAALALTSSLVISKDEWEHRELCTGFENWLHSLLFMLHPTVLIWSAWLWSSQNENFTIVVGGAAVLSGIFFIYQLVYWNLIAR